MRTSFPVAFPSRVSYSRSKSPGAARHSKEAVGAGIITNIRLPSRTANIDYRKTACLFKTPRPTSVCYRGPSQPVKENRDSRRATLSMVLPSFVIIAANKRDRNVLRPAAQGAPCWQCGSTKRKKSYIMIRRRSLCTPEPRRRDGSFRDGEPSHHANCPEILTLVGALADNTTREIPETPSEVGHRWLPSVSFSPSSQEARSPYAGRTPAGATAGMVTKEKCRP